jgi:hypothetical protein
VAQIIQKPAGNGFGGVASNTGDAFSNPGPRLFLVEVRPVPEEFLAQAIGDHDD